jgi:hypothetical protein
MAKDASVLSLSGIAAEADGKRYLVLLADFGDADDSAQSYTVLAAFEAGADPRLVDAVEVGADRFTGFGTPAVLKLGAGDAVVVRSSHHNSNQSYVSTSIALLRNGRFALVDRISLLSDRTCAGEWNQTLSLAAKPEPGQAYASIAASVREERKPSRTCRGEKPLKPLSRTISVSYRWDPAHQAYRPSSQAFEQLAREASDRM